MRVEVLEKRVAELEAENLRLRQGGEGNPLAIKPSRKPREKKVRKRRKQAFVRRREAPDEIQYHAVENCPQCGRKLCGGWEHYRRQTIEVILPRLQVIEHVVVRRRCGVCGKHWTPSLQAIEVQGKRRFGVNLQSLVATLHIACRLPMKMVRRLLRELCGLRLSAGAVVDLLDGVEQAGKAELTRLHDAVRGSPAVCADETGWREDGENGYVWTFSTPQLRWFVYDNSRAGAVPKEVLGEAFAGVVVSDFYAGYNKLEGIHQRCWVHRLKDLKALKEANADRPEVVAWAEAVKRLYEEAKAFSSPRAAQHRQEQRRCMKALKELASPYAKVAQAPQRVLAERLLKYLSEMFVFVGDPRVPSDNNLAERSLRPAVIARKISGGTRSEKGSKTKMALMSLFGTWTLQGQPLLPSCRQLLAAAN